MIGLTFTLRERYTNFYNMTRRTKYQEYDGIKVEEGEEACQVHTI